MGGTSTKGTWLYYGTPGVDNAVPTTWIEVAEVIGAGPPDLESPAVPNHNLRDTFRKKRAGRLMDSEDVTISVLFDPNLPEQAAIRELITTPDTNNKFWKISFNGDGLDTSASVTWQGPVTKFSESEAENDDDENFEAEVTIAVGSLPVWAAGEDD
jgi:hypothetical protein